MRFTRSLKAGAGVAVLALALAACGGGGGSTGASETGNQSLADKAKSTQKVVVGIKFDQPGLGLKQPDGTYAGFDVDVAKYVAKELGVPESGITFKEAQSAERENLIQKGEVDFIVATYSITDARKQKVNFGGPYFVAHQDLLVRSDNTDITGPDSLNGNKKLCSVKAPPRRRRSRTPTPRTSSSRSTASTPTASPRCSTAALTPSRPTTSSSRATRPHRRRASSRSSARASPTRTTASA